MGKVKCLRQLHENAVRLILKGDKRKKSTEQDINTCCELITAGQKQLQGVNYNLEAQRI